MRISNSIKNIKYNLIFFILNSVLSFVSKTVLIKYIGTEYAGLSSVLMSVIGLLSVTELGIGTAVMYSLYTPLHNKDYNKINSIMNLYKKIYKIIGCIIFTSCLVLMLYIDKLIHSSIPINEVRIYFMVYSIMTAISYFTTYPQVLINADQKSYVVSKTLGTINIIKTILQVISVVIFKSYIIWMIIQFVGTIFSYIYINKTIKNTYLWLDLNIKKSLKEEFYDNRDILKNTKNIFIHKLAYVVGYQTDNIIISAFTNLNTITIYTNYTLVVNVVRNIAFQLLGGIKASIGDLIAENNIKKSYEIFNKINLVCVFLSTVLSYCVYVNIDNLMTIWLGSEFIINKEVVFLICLLLFIQIIINPVSMFLEGYGLYQDIFAPIIEGGMNFIISILLTKKYGIAGVMVGTVVSHLIINNIWKPYFLYKKGFRKNFISYIKNTAISLLISLVSIKLSNMILSNIVFQIFSNNTINFIINSLISLVCISIIYFIVSILNKDYRSAYKYLFSIIRKNINVKNLG